MVMSWFNQNLGHLPSGKLLHNYGTSPFLMGKSTISMAIFNSFFYVYQRVYGIIVPYNSSLYFFGKKYNSVSLPGWVNLHFPMVFLWFSRRFDPRNGPP